jgi:hypothetical protein
MREWKQVAAVTVMSLRSIPDRLGSSLVVVIGRVPSKSFERRRIAIPSRAFWASSKEIIAPL